MRSTPLFIGGRLYHLRYDLNAVWDMECIIPGGFYSILDKPLTYELISDLLWFGLKWDNPDLTATDTRKLVKEMIRANRSILTNVNFWLTGTPPAETLLPLLRACKDELFVSGWYVDPDLSELRKMPQAHKDPDKPYGVVDLITHLEKMAHFCGYPGDVWQLTPNEIFSFVDSRRERDEMLIEQADYNAAKVCATLYNVNRKRDSDPILSPSDFMPDKKAGKAQTSGEMMDIIRTANVIFGGTNGS